MGAFQNTFKSLRIAAGYTQDEIAQKLGLSRSAIGMYENGTRTPDYETMEVIADFFNVDIDYLYGRTMKSTLLPESRSRFCVRIPVLGRVAAGKPIDAIEDTIGYEEIPESLARTGEFFALRIKGDSMSPNICDGDVVIVRHQSDAESSDIVIATVNGNEAVCKRLRKYDGGIELISNNPSYDPMPFSSEDIEKTPVNILGKVIQLRRNLG